MKRSVADIIAATGPISAKVDLGDGYSAPVVLDGSCGATPTVDIEDLTGAVLDGSQPTGKDGLIRVNLPKAIVSVKGVLTSREAKRTAKRTAEVVAACLYASVGLDIPDDLLPHPKAEVRPEVQAALAANGTK